MIRSKANYNNDVALKFIIYKIKTLITDNRGKYRYIDNFDTIINDIFGVKHLARKINDAYDNREVICLLEEVGTKYLFELVNNSKLYSVLNEMVSINYRLSVLKKEIHKQRKKDKRDNDLIKDYNYLSELYKKTVKYLRKKFGIKDTRTSYKRKYKSLNELVSKNKKDEYSSILSRGDSFFDEYDLYDDDDDDDDDDEYYDDSATSELDDFVQMLHGKKPKSEKLRKRARNNTRYDIYDDDDDEDDDDEYYEYLEKSRRQTKNRYDDVDDDRIDKLADVVSDLSSAVQSLMAKDEYESAKRRRELYGKRRPINIEDLDDSVIYERNTLERDYPRYDKKPDQPSETQILMNFIDKVTNKQLEMEKTQRELILFLKDMSDQQDKIVDAVNDLISEENYEDEEEDSGLMKAYMRARSEDDNYIGNIDLDDVPTKYPNGVEITRSELIDLINQSGEPTPDVQPPAN